MPVGLCRHSIPQCVLCDDGLYLYYREIVLCYNVYTAQLILINLFWYFTDAC